MYNLSKMNQEEIENINRPITSTEIKIIVKNLPINKSPGPDGFMGKFYWKFREELTPILLKLFHKISQKTPKPILQGYYHLDTKTRQTKLQANITDEHRCKNPQQNSSKQNPTTH